MAKATITFTDTPKGSVMLDIALEGNPEEGDERFDLTPAMLHAVSVKTLHHMGWLSEAGAATLESIEDGADLYQKVYNRINEKEKDRLGR